MLSLGDTATRLCSLLSHCPRLPGTLLPRRWPSTSSLRTPSSSFPPSPSTLPWPCSARPSSSSTCLLAAPPLPTASPVVPCHTSARPSLLRLGEQAQRLVCPVARSRPPGGIWGLSERFQKSYLNCLQKTRTDGKERSFYSPV